MVLVTHKLQGSHVLFPWSSPTWTKDLIIKQPVTALHFVGREEKHLRFKQNCCFSLVSPCNGKLKAKPFRVTSFKGGIQNKESGGNESGKKLTNNSVKRSYWTDDDKNNVNGSPKAQNTSISYMSKTEDSITEQPAIQKLFKKWLTMLRTKSPIQVFDKYLGGEQVPETMKPETETGIQKTESLHSTKNTVWSCFWSLDAAIKIPLLFLFLLLSFGIRAVDEGRKKLRKMPPKKDDAPWEKAVADLQRDVEKLSGLEQVVLDMKAQLGKLSFLEKWEERFREQEIQAARKEKAPLGSQTSGVVADLPEGYRPSRSRSVSPRPRENREEGGQEPLTRKIDIPIFDGENVESWIFRMDQYFELGGYTEEEKLHTVKMSFDEDALLWYRWERDRNPFRNWEEMKTRVLANFVGHQSNPCEQLLTIQQCGSFRDYNREFITLAANSRNLPEQVLETAYLIGLRPEVRVRVKLHEPKSLEKMMMLALGIDDCLNLGEDSSTGPPEKERSIFRAGEQLGRDMARGDQGKFAGAISSFGRWTKFNEKGHTTSFEEKGKNASSPSRIQSRKVPYRRLTPEEIEDRKKKSFLAPGGLFQPFPIPDRIWEDISLDFVEGLPKSQSYTGIMVVVDRLSKYAHFLEVKHRFSAKLTSHFYDPFPITARLVMSCIAAQSPEAKIHPTFHVSQLKKVVGELPPIYTIPTQLQPDGELQVKPIAVLDTRVHRRTGHEELLIQWKNFLAYKCSWELKKVIARKFSHFNLEDKVDFEGGNIDKYEVMHLPIVYTYEQQSG